MIGSKLPWRTFAAMTDRTKTTIFLIPLFGLVALLLGMHESNRPPTPASNHLEQPATLIVEPGEVVKVRISNSGQFQHRIRIEAPSGDIQWSPEVPIANIE